MNNKIALCVLLVAAAQVAEPAEWYSEPFVLYTGEFSDNRTLSSNDKEDTLGNLLSAGVKLGRDTETSRFYFEPSVIVRRYDDEDEVLDTEDGYLQLYFNRVRPKSRFIFAINYRNESTLTSEIPSADDGNPDLEDPIQDDTGDADVSVTRQRVNVRPKMNFSLTERTRLVLGGRYTQVNFDEQQGVTKTDYDSYGLNSGLEFKSSEKLTLLFGVSASTYEADTTLNTTDNYSAELGLRYNLSELTQLSLNAGALRSEATFTQNSVPVSEESTDPIYELGIRRTTETAEFGMHLSRKVSPSGSGFQTIRDQLLVSYDRELSERLRLILRGRYFDSESTDVGVTARDRKYGRAEIEFDWQLTRRMVIGFAYHFTTQERDTVGRSADSNTAIVRFGYRPRRIRFNR